MWTNKAHHELLGQWMGKDRVRIHQCLEGGNGSQVYLDRSVEEAQVYKMEKKGKNVIWGKRDAVVLVKSRDFNHLNL